ncbi:MAG: oligoribonuclease [Enterococcus sp.]|nr:oligoribonuclease [Enterococcus sp.]
MSESIIWIDVETTGVKAFGDDELLEVACLITDSDLNVLDDKGFHAVIKHSDLQISRMKLKTSDYVLEMHNKTGLWDKLPLGLDMKTVDAMLLEYIKNFVSEPRTARIAGNSITLDRNFLEANLPLSYGHLHYRSYDVSTIAGLAAAWYQDAGYKKMLTHAAMDDIRESIEELKYYRERIFVKKSWVNRLFGTR